MAVVRRRRVCYVSGFDPQGARHYHGLYREQAARQAAAGGLALEVGPRRNLPDGDACWTVRATEDGVDVSTTYHFLRWDDLVRQHWPRARWRLWRDIVVATLFNLRHGSLLAMARLAWPMALALFIPFAMVCGMLFVGVPLALGAGWLAATGAGHWLAAPPAAALVLFALGHLERALERRYNMYWLMRSYAFMRLQALGRTPAYEARVDEHAAKLADWLRTGEEDELLVVGHSSGANVAVQIVARALRLAGPREPGARPVLSLLTLGQCLPGQGTHPQAAALRQEIAELGQAAGLHWIDFSAPPDGCCFPLCDPVTALRVPGPPPLPDHPKLLSPRFAEMFDPADYRALRRDKFRMHFQYIQASARPVEYDYFRITAGARTLAARYAHLPSVRDWRGLRLFG